MFTEIWLFTIEAAKIFVDILRWMIILEVFLSLLMLVGVQIYIGPLAAITHPLYTQVKKLLPTRLGPLDFAPAIVFLGLNMATYFLEWIRNFILHNL